MVILLFMSVKSRAQVAMNPLLPTWPMHFENFPVVWRMGIRTYMMNSATVTITSLIGNMLLSCIAAYVFARYSFPGRNLLFSLILGLMVIPGITTLIPTYVVVRDLKLLGSLWGVIIPNIMGANAFNIFVLRTFFASLPEELFEAARIDGAGHLRIFTSIVIPLSWAIISSLAVMMVMGTWNDYVWPLLVLNREKLQTIAIGLVFFADSRNPEIGLQMAASVIASIPMIILFFIAMRSFIEGLASGAIKM
ncbi:MAG: carbohydrate ABC transporter permease [Anaerolineae bacterium]